MANISVRGLEPETLSKLKALAKKENISVNALVLRLLDRVACRRQSRCGSHPGKTHLPTT